jgi:hypothetical protein
MGKSYQLDTERFDDHDEVTVTDSLDQAMSLVVHSLDSGGSKRVV